LIIWLLQAVAAELVAVVVAVQVVVVQAVI
jgi:hypothetical protein